MSRKIQYIKKRVSYSDRYNCPILGKFINFMMLNGKKSVAERIVYRAMDEAAKKLEVDAHDMFKTVIENTKLEHIILRRKIGANYVQIPHPIEEPKQISVAILNLKNIIRDLQKQSGNSVIECMVNIFTQTYQNKGPAIKQKDDLEQLAMKNRVFSHYSWMRKRINQAQNNSKRKKNYGNIYEPNAMNLKSQEDFEVDKENNSKKDSDNTEETNQSSQGDNSNEVKNNS